MEQKKTFLDLLMEAGDVAETLYADELQAMRTKAQRALVGLNKADMRRAKQIGMEQELIKLQRNAAALEYLLSMAHQAAEYIHSGLREICLANDVAELHRTEYECERRKQIEESAKKKLQNEKYRAKKDPEAQTETPQDDPEQEQ